MAITWTYLTKQRLKSDRVNTKLCFMLSICSCCLNCPGSKTFDSQKFTTMPSVKHRDSILYIIILCHTYFSQVIVHGSIISNILCLCFFTFTATNDYFLGSYISCNLPSRSFTHIPNNSGVAHLVWKQNHVDDIAQLCF